MHGSASLYDKKETLGSLYYGSLGSHTIFIRVHDRYYCRNNIHSFNWAEVHWLRYTKIIWIQ